VSERSTEVRWCPECEEPHVGGCPWAELEKRPDPTVKMPETGPRKVVSELAEAFARIGDFERHLLLPLVLGAALLFPISMHFYALDVAQAEAEAQLEIAHQRSIEISMEMERLERAMAEARMQAMESERRLLEVLAAEPSHD
jgi:hypothetical protein